MIEEKNSILQPPKKVLKREITSTTFFEELLLLKNVVPTPLNLVSKSLGDQQVQKVYD